MKKTFLILAVLILVALACDLSVNVNPAVTPASLPTGTALPATGVPTWVPASVTPFPVTPVVVATLTPAQPTLPGVEVSVDPLSLVLPPALATGARGLQVPYTAGPGVSSWDVTPGHVQLKLEGYPLQGTTHQPQIYVYPAQAYAELYPAAFESMHRLNNVLASSSVPLTTEELPAVPFFNARPAFISNVQLVSFQNGRGVRFLTEYAQYPVSANNQDLFYNFLGFTSDGAYYVVAILPVSFPLLAETSAAGAFLPSGGIPYPDMASPNADFPAYYAAVTSLLGSAPSETFTPALGQLDALILSLHIAQ